MVRFHYHFAVVCGVMFTIGLCNAQEMPLQPYSDVHIIGEPVITESPAIEHDEMWPYAESEAHGGDAEWQHGEIGHDGHDSDEGHGAHAHISDNYESLGLICEGKCGEKHCHGVCRDPGHPAKPRREKPGDVNRGDCPPKRYCMSDLKRAGFPHCVAPWAKCSVDRKYSAWYVGGGAAFFRGRCRTSEEGTWGLDYDGFFGGINNWLNYTRCRNQGGEGAYETDGEPEFVSRVGEFLPFGH